MDAGYFLTRAAERYPERPAWIDAQRVVTFRHAADRVGRLAQALISMGGQPGDRVGLLMPNCPEGLEAILAPIQAGMAAVPMNIRLHPDEHAYMLNGSGAFALIAGAEFRTHVSRMREGLASYEKPQSVEFLPGLPKNAYGKVLKRELRDRYWVDRRRKV